MKSGQEIKNKNVFLFFFVFLFVWMLAFSLCKYKQTERGSQKNTIRPAETEEQRKEESPEEDFATKNSEQIKELKAIEDKLIKVIPELGVTGREFNRKLLSVIALLRETEGMSVEDWRKFQTEFAFEYENLNKGRRDSKNLPKQVQESEDKIMEILQELNDVIQRMHK